MAFLDDIICFAIGSMMDNKTKKNLKTNELKKKIEVTNQVLKNPNASEETKEKARKIKEESIEMKKRLEKK